MAGLLYLHALPYILLLNILGLWMRSDHWNFAEQWPSVVEMLAEIAFWMLAGFGIAFGLEYAPCAARGLVSMVGGSIAVNSAGLAAFWIAIWIAAGAGAGIAAGVSLGIATAVVALSPLGTSGGIAGGLVFAVTGSVAGAIVGGVATEPTGGLLAWAGFVSAGGLALTMTTAFTVLRSEPSRRPPPPA